MALQEILNPPSRVQFVVKGQGSVVASETILGGVLPLPDFTISEDVILTIDATPRQGHSLTRQVPQFPVEKGVDISDDYQLRPKRLTLDGVVSDTPMDLIQSITAQIANITAGETPSAAAWEIIKGLMGEEIEGTTLKPELIGEPFDVITGLDLYQNMVIENMAVSRTVSTGKSIQFTMSLLEIRTVSAEVVSTGEGTGKPINTAETTDSGRVGANDPSQFNATAALQVGVSMGVLAATVL